MSQPIKVKLEENEEYYYCTCGKSGDGIFCNGEHKNTEFKPTSFKVEETKDYYLCPCKNSSNEPFCDGSHQN